MKFVIVLVIVAFGLLGGLSALYRWNNASLAPPAIPAQSARSSPEQEDVPTVSKKQILIAPDIVSDTWLNTKPLAPSDLRGHVVLVEFFTYG